MKLKTYRVDSNAAYLDSNERDFLETDSRTGIILIVATSVTKAIEHAKAAGWHRFSRTYVHVASGLDVEALSEAGLLDEDGTILFSGESNWKAQPLIGRMRPGGVMEIAGRWNPIPGKMFNAVAVERSTKKTMEGQPVAGNKKRDWNPPEWMVPFLPFISTGGNPVKEMMDDESAVFINAPRALLAMGVKAQVGLLMQLHEQGFLKVPDRS